MAGVLRFSASLAQRQCRRGFRTSALYSAAQNFTMPAMSPTMTEGNIAAWRLKEGDSFAPGDVLLEIETDKAQMDVEAQEEGVLFKITQQDGAKGVKVGARIAVLAETGDDLSSLEMPADEPSQSEQSSEAKAKDASKPAESSKGESSTPSKSESSPEPSESKSSSPAPSRNQAPQKYPLYPSVMVLLKENGLTKDDANKIPATGPNGRLLKGDVLAYVGKIDKDYSANQSKRLEKLAHLDLSNITLAEPKKPAPSAAAAAEELPTAPQDTEIAMHISLSAVIATQKRVQDTMGIRLPLSVFIARASELANDDLPRASSRSNTDELFYSVLGLDAAVPRSSRGNYFPAVTNLPALPPVATAPLPRKRDVFDELVGASPVRRTTATTTLPPLVGTQGVASPMNIFSVVARPGEEKRVETYLEKMKLVLEAEPGRLVL